MPWVVGIDEAGYGPNLGPLVEACVGLYLPDEDRAGWKSLSESIRRAGDPPDRRLVVDDSKRVYSGGNGFDELERTVLSISIAREIGQRLLGLSSRAGGKHRRGISCSVAEYFGQLCAREDGFGA